VEYVLVFQKPGGKPLLVERTEEERKASCFPIDDLYTKEIAHNLWHIAAVQPHTSPHPSPFPEELAYRLISLYSYVGDTVLDPFVGSGTTAKVARLTGRDYIGYETNPAFFRLAQQRIEDTTLHRQRWIVRFEPAAGTEPSLPTSPANPETIHA
jgi:DNA modification methylase